MLRGSPLHGNLLTYQLYGANTDVGKTIFSTILCKALTRTKNKTWYLKPVSTGPLDEADDAHIKQYAPQTATRSLLQFRLAASPHIAAASEGRTPPPPDKIIVNSILEHLQSCAQESYGSNGAVLIETAGGVNSPTPSGSSQADLYRPLRLPIFLVADAKLGGISSTICAFESLFLRGYDLDCVLVFQDEKYQNYSYLSQYFLQRSIHTVSLPPPPPRAAIASEDQQQMSTYYEMASKSGSVEELLALSRQRHNARIERLESMAEKAHKSIWYPFTQHQDLTPKKILTIDSAHGDFFQTLRPPSPLESCSLVNRDRKGLLRSTFDGSASWWTQGLRRGSSALSLAAAYAAGRYGHVMFAGAIHEPALSLAELLLTHLENPRLRKVFYSDDGSTGMEVAVKMALKASSKRYGWLRSDRIDVLGLKGSYHGDTLGAMDLSERSTYNEKVSWYEGRGYWFDIPRVKMKNLEWIVEPPEGLENVFGPNAVFKSLGEVFSTNRDESEMAKKYAHHIRQILAKLVKEGGQKFGTLVLEPVILGAGGMLFCDPLFQRTLVNVVRSSQDIFGPRVYGELTWQGLPVIFDEVFTGMYRLGSFTPSSLLYTDPDIIVHAKLLTGGLVPLCTTTTSDSIYEAFLSDEKSNALLHGHSYTAHPIGCQVACTSIQSMLDMDNRGGWDQYKRDWVNQQKDSGLSANLVLTGKPRGDTRIWSMWGKDFVSQISQAQQVESIVALGSVLAISLKDVNNAGYTSTIANGLHNFLLETETELGANIHCRVLGNVLYLMASLTSEAETVRWIEGRLLKALNF